MSLIEETDNLESLRNSIKNELSYLRKLRVFSSKKNSRESLVQEEKLEESLVQEEKLEESLVQEESLEYELLNTIIYLTGLYFYDKNSFIRKKYIFTSLELEYFYNSSIYDEIEYEKNYSKEFSIKRLDYSKINEDILDNTEKSLEELIAIEKIIENPTIKLTRQLLDKKYKGKDTFKNVYSKIFKVCLLNQPGIKYNSSTYIWNISPDTFLENFYKKYKKNLKNFKN